MTVSVSATGPAAPDPFAGHAVCVAGIAVSGAAAAQALLARGARVTVVDERDGAAEADAAATLERLGADVRLGKGATAALPDGTELVVTSPGWRPDAPLLRAALDRGLEVIGEPELAWRIRPRRGDRPPAPWIAVTGTNGKTTTVGMVASILRAAGLRAVAAGNVGTSLVEAVLEQPAYDVLAVELSSFQLHWSRELAPEAAVVLNLADDHRDWHGSFDAYAEAKARIWRARGCGAYNADDPLVARLAREHLDDPHPFTLGAPPSGGIGVADGLIVDRMAGWQPDLEDEPPQAAGGIVLASVDDVTAPGAHNLANALAAVTVVRVAALSPLVDVRWPAFAAGLRAFRPGAHRNELVATGGGVAYVDDSKATNPHAAAASLSAYDRVVWIAGGLLKGADVDGLVAAHAHRLRGVVLIGRDRAQIAAALARHAPDVPVVEVAATETGAMREAVRTAARMAVPGDTVLMAPAAASMDMFVDYADRGAQFAAAARELAAGAGERAR